MEQEPQPDELNLRRRMDELESMFQLRTSELTLGHAAVAYANHHAAIVLEMGQYGEETDEYQRYSMLEKSSGPSIIGELQDVRQTIDEISFNNQWYLEQYLEAQAHGTYLVRMLRMAEKKEETSLTWKKWLSKYATNDQLLNFLQFHNQIIERQQTHPQIQEALNAQKQKFVKGTEYAREHGTLVGSLDGLDEVEFYVGDIFNMVMKEQIGFYLPGTNKVHIEQAYRNKPDKHVQEFLDNIPYTATHELVHAVLGESHKQYDSPLAARWIDEAITEELARVIDRQIGSIKEEDTIYSSERALLTLLLSHGSADITLGYKLAIRGYSGSKDDRDKFESYLDTIWGMEDVLGKLNQAIELEEVSYTQVDPRSLRGAQSQVLESIYARLRDEPDSIFVQYEEAIKMLPNTVAQE